LQFLKGSFLLSVSSSKFSFFLLASHGDGGSFFNFKFQISDATSNTLAFFAHEWLSSDLSQTPFDALALCGDLGYFFVDVSNFLSS